MTYFFENDLFPVKGLRGFEREEENQIIAPLKGSLDEEDFCSLLSTWTLQLIRKEDNSPDLPNLQEAKWMGGEGGGMKKTGPHFIFWSLGTTRFFAFPSIGAGAAP